MSEMSFKQAKELVEKLDLTELSIKSACENFDESSKKFNESMLSQVKVLNYAATLNKKVSNLRVVVMFLTGLIIGLLVGFYILK